MGYARRYRWVLIRLADLHCVELWRSVSPSVAAIDAGESCRCRDRWLTIERLAERYIQDEILAPLYRLPTTAHSSTLPILLAEGALDKGEVAALIEFVAEVDELNRGLDRCANTSGEPTQIAEAERNKRVARRLTSSGVTFQAANQIHVGRS